MGLSLLLSLLLLPTCLQPGRSEECDSKYDYGIKQPDHLSAPMGGSVHIRFSFYYCWELAKDPRVSIALRRGQFHGQVIYNSTQSFIHEEYKNRISLNLPTGQKSGSLWISNLRKEDENIYFCRIQVKTLRNGMQVWQSLQGTRLTVTHAAEKTTEGPTTTAPTTTAPTTTDLSVLEGTGSSASSPLSVGAAVGVALAGAVLILAILGLILYLWWKRSKDLQTKARTVARGSFQNTEEKYENIGIKRQQTGPQLEPKLEPKVEPKDEAQNNSGILYASLTLSSSSLAASPCIPPKERPQEETLYSLIKA
ncbi:paired immunoglobulin-like type 2 receptor alpha isoform X1 [Eumetopias jubatus]|uniref:paired immunoglobulin-like type 2 receptor alpha isoform X1 n=1 Tax=Eumetopias jubatus TaxID=34886 RepID=UPI0010160C9D|nr:paired immunoglobulin-like type 2 receptor alpha isoform X1 [Eumetopias jubatus]